MKAQTRIGYETPDISVIYIITDDNTLLQNSLETQELEDTTPVDGSWK